MNHLLIEPLESRIAPATLSITPAVAHPEGNSGTTDFAFVVTLAEAPTSGNVSFNFHVDDGTATTADSDYQDQMGTLTFTAAEIANSDFTKTIVVRAVGDTRGENDETFSVTIDMPSAGTTIAAGTGTGTIQNDARLTTTSNFEVFEGNTGQFTPINFTVTLTEGPLTGDVTVDYRIDDGTGGGGATVANNDYQAVTPATFTFSPGAATAQTLAVQVVGDNNVETNETFQFVLANPVGATLGNNNLFGTIKTDPLTVIATPIVEGASGVQQMNVRIELSDYEGGFPVKVKYTAAGGTATGGTDFSTVTNAVLTFATGETFKDVTVTIYGDTTVEQNETINFTASFAPAGEQSGGVTAPVFSRTEALTILNDEVSLSIADPTALAEGAQGSSSVLNFTVTLNGGATNPVTFHYRTINGTGAHPATGDSDFTAVSDLMLTFAPGETTKLIPISFIGDDTAEFGENFSVEIFQAEATGAVATISRATATGTIINDDSNVGLGPAPSLTEGNSGTKIFDFPVTLSQAFAEDVTVRFSTADASAVAANGDYVAVPDGSITIPAGMTTGHILIQVRGDTEDEGDQTFSVNLRANPTDFIYGGNAILRTATILDDDPHLRIEDVTVTEGNTGSVTALFRVTLTAALAADTQVTVDFTTLDGTAKDGVGEAVALRDYVAKTDTLTFAQGESEKTIAIEILGDLRRELTTNPALVLSENFFVQLSNAKFLETNMPDVEYPIGRDTATGTILDTDANPTISIAGVSVAEGAAATTATARFTVTLSAVSDYNVSFDYATQDGTATIPNSDYVARSGTITFAPGEFTKDIDVVVNGDAANEPNETFTVKLTNAVIALPSNSGVTITQDTATGTILNDESVLTFGAAPSFTEGSAGTMNFLVQLTDTGTRAHPVVVNFTTQEAGTAPGRATAGSDFTTTAGTLTFAVGETQKTIAVPILNDAFDEVDQTFQILLSSVAGATGTGLLQSGTIVDDDAAPVVRILSPVTFTEGDNATGQTTAGTANFTVQLTAASQQEITVKYTTTAGTATATAPMVTGDFTPATAVTLTFAPGETSKTIAIPIVGDLLDESNETFKVTLTEPSASVTLDDLKKEATATIFDNDVLPVLTIADVSGLENGGPLTFTVRLSAASGQTVSVNYATANGTATSTGDYTTATGSLEFAPGDLMKTFTVDLTADTVDESDERFFVRLSNAANATVVDNEALGTIQNDDNTFTIHNLTVAEEGTARIEVTRTGTLTAASVQYTTKDGTAATGAAKASGARPDFTATTGTLTFGAGVQSLFIDVPITTDAHYEFDETFTVEISSPAGGVIATGGEVGTVTITNTDSRPTLSVASVTATEGAASIGFNVQLSAANERETVTVQNETVDGTAVASGPFADFNGVSSELRFTTEAGVVSTAQFIALTLLDDPRDEDDQQTFQFVLKNAVNATLSGGGATLAATGTINDNDAAPTLSVNDLGFTENSVANATRSFTARLSALSEKTVTVNWSTEPRTPASGPPATPGADFTAVAPTPLTFAPGEQEKALLVPVLDDALDEPNEFFEVVLLGTPTNATLADARGLGTIEDDADAAPVVSINDVTVTEGTGDLVFTVSLSAPSGREVTVNFATADGTAKVGGPFADYLATSGLLTFAAGDVAKTITVSVLDDIFQEGTAVQQSSSYIIADEKLTVTLTSPTGATLGDATGEGTIANGADGVVGIAITDASVVEGDISGATTTTALTFRVQLSVPTQEDVTFHAATRNGTAIAGADYVALSQDFTIPGESMPGSELLAGADGISITVTINRDADTGFEASESLFLDLSAFSSNVTPSGADTAGLLHARGTILDDDFQIINGGRTVQWIDVDGDRVTLNITAGTLSLGNFDFDDAGTLGGRRLVQLNLIPNVASYMGASITITADTQPGLTGTGDGRVNVGEILAGGRLTNQFQWIGADLNTIRVDGDLLRFSCGDIFSTTALKKLEVFSLGVFGIEPGTILPNGSEADGSDSFSEVLGPIGMVHVETDVEGRLSIIGQEFGTLGKLFIDGALRGNAFNDSGQVIVTGRIGAATLGDIVGGTGARSGSLRGDAFTGGTIGNVIVEGAIIGGGTARVSASDPGNQDAGSIRAAVVGNVTVGTLPGGVAIQGGIGETSGAIIASSSLGKVKVFGSIVGGAGSNSGNIQAVAMGTLTVEGSLRGGTGEDSGSVISLSNMGKVSITGGGLVGGTGVQSGNLQAVNLPSVTVDALTGGAGTDSGNILVTGVLGKVSVTGDVTGGTGGSSGAIIGSRGVGAVTIGGDLIGGAGTQSAIILSFVSIASVSIAGEVIGGGGTLAGAIAGDINSGASVGKVLVAGAVTGGAGTNSGQIVGARLSDITIDRLVGGTGASSGTIRTEGLVGTTGKITVLKEIAGGTGANSGAISATGKVREIKLGKDSAGDSIIGSSGTGSGRINVANDVGSISATGDVEGGTSTDTGAIRVGGRLDKLVVGGSVHGGDSPATGNGIQNTGLLQIGLLGNATITGNLEAGESGGSPLANSGVIRAGRIESLTIGGNVTGTAATPAIISGAASIDASDVAIRSLLIKGDVTFAEILAGYNGGVNLSTGDFRGNRTSADAQIGTVEIGGTVQGLNIVAGAVAGTDGRFGDATDRLATQADVAPAFPPVVLRDSAKVISQISSIIFKGSTVANADLFGIVAQHIVGVKVGSTPVALALTKGPGNDLAPGKTIATNFQAVELAV